MGILSKSCQICWDYNCNCIIEAPMVEIIEKTSNYEIFCKFAMEYTKSIYTEHNLPYHNWAHIMNMVHNIENYKTLYPNVLNKHNTALLTIAILFHDVIYDTCNTDNHNVNLSADLFEKLARENIQFKFSEYNISLIKRLILATTNHAYKSIIDDVSKVNNILHNIIIELDLMILASDYEKYVKYARQIRLEYAQYNNMEYANGRCSVLNKLLQKAKKNELFWFNKELNQKATANITNELKGYDI